MSAITLSSIACNGGSPQDFLAALPAVQRHAQIQFQNFNPVDAEESTAEAVAAAYVSYLALAGRGQLHRAYPSTLADFAVLHVRSDRHIGGHQSRRDVMSRAAQRRREFRMELFAPRVGSDPRDRDTGQWHPVFMEDRKVSPADMAAFNVDFAEWFSRQKPRDCRVITALADGHGTGAVARRIGISAARVSELRRKFERSWHQFQGEPVPTAGE